jgi:hypothetical protein
MALHSLRFFGIELPLEKGEHRVVVQTSHASRERY